MSNSQSSKKKLIQIKPINPVSISEENGLEETIVEEQRKLTQLREEINELNHEKESLLEQTNIEINKAKQEWDNEKQQYIELANKEGFDAGYTQGKETAIKEYKALIANANSIIKSATNDYHASVEKSEETIIDIALQVANKIMKQKIMDTPEVLLPIVMEAINSLKDKSVITIYLNPNNYQHVLKQKNELMQIVDSKSELSILVDENAVGGSCVIEHPYGKIDASVDTQLNQIRDVLFELTNGE